MTTWGERMAFRGDDGTIDSLFYSDAGARPAIQFFGESKPDKIWCAKCGSLQEVLIDAEFQNGFLVSCQGCGDERVISYQRTNAEAA